MSEQEHLDAETTDPVEPAEWEPWDDEDWWRALDYDVLADRVLRRVRDLRAAPGLLDGVDEQRPADFDDDEETRP
jgi:hypothetical protein